MKLLNVRLAPEDARKVAQLREAGVPISRLVREAIRVAHEQQATRRAPRRRPSEIMAEIYGEHPDPRAGSRRTLDLRDRGKVRRAIRRRLRRRRA